MAIYAVLACTCVLVIIMAHMDARSKAMENAWLRLQDATQLAAAQVNGDHVTLLLNKYPEPGAISRHTQDPWYYVMHEKLRRAGERIQLDEPLVLITEDGDGRTVSVASGHPSVPFRVSLPQTLIRSLASSEGPHAVRARSELIATAEVLDHSETVTAMVVGRMTRGEALRPAVDALQQHLLWGFLVLAAAGLVLFSSVGRWLSRSEAALLALHQQQAQVEDSLAYAAKIQRSLAPDPAYYRSFFQDVFIIDKPKQLVSGDFHWVFHVSDTVSYVAAADCTGHGIPGAMMATIGNALLNEVVPLNTHLDPAELLSLINARLLATLHQQGRQRGAGDGMDIALCRVDKERQEILFAGAHRPLYWSHEGRITVINGDRRPIGGSHHDPERRYTVHRIAYAKDDRIYLFSDGYVDQFGGPQQERFQSNRLQELLNAHQHLPLHQQHALLERAFTDWKGAAEQVDDVCLLGLVV